MYYGINYSKSKISKKYKLWKIKKVLSGIKNQQV